MADLSKIKLNGTEYDLKDNWIRENSGFIPKMYFYYSDTPTESSGPITLYKKSTSEYDTGENNEVYTLNDFAIGGIVGGSYLVWVEQFDGENNINELYILSYGEYRWQLDQIATTNGFGMHFGEYKHFKTNSFAIPQGSSMNDTATITLQSITTAPTAEYDQDVISMLQNLGLNTTITLSPAEADETTAGSSVLTS